jgi:alkylation response protein AidB-like acyl-CoA dehydrogenase
LDAASSDEMPAARAAASELCWRAAAQLMVATGGRSVLTDQHAQRLAREAMFLLVFGSRPSIKAALLHRLTL